MDNLLSRVVPKPGLGFGDRQATRALGDAPDDEVDASTRTFLALTVGCARCHDHKLARALRGQLLTKLCTLLQDKVVDPFLLLANLFFMRPVRCDLLPRHERNVITPAVLENAKQGIVIPSGNRIGDGDGLSRDLAAH